MRGEQVESEIITIESGSLRLKINRFGGAFESFVDKETGEEMMWDVDPAIWDRRDILIFPFCGRLKDGFYTHNGREYRLSIHGFVKDGPLDVVSRTENSVTLFKASSPQTLAEYPFPFEFRVTYTAEGSTARCRYEVTNAGDETMYFGLGAHFGAKTECAGGDIRGTFVDFDRPVTEYVPIEDNYALPPRALDDPMRRMKTDGAFFDRYNTFIACTPGGGGLTFSRPGGALRFTFESPYLALWSGGGGFVCVEPWWGLCDFLSPTRELCRKSGLRSLAGGKRFSAGYTITALHGGK